MLRSDGFVLSSPTAPPPMILPVEGISTRTDIAFSNAKGVEKSGVRKTAERLIKQLAPALQRFLAADEFLVYVCGGCAPMSGVEQYTYGYFSQLVSRISLVLTNKRLLIFRTDTKGKWRRSWRACSLGDIRSAKVSGLLFSRQMKLEYANGKKETYWGLAPRDKTKLKALMPKLLEANAGAQTAAQGTQPMCPSCAAKLTERQYQCAACGQQFRGEEPLWWRSLIPGGAYFYVKQTGLGIVHAVVDTFFTLETILLLIGALAAKPQDRAEGWILFGWFAFLMLVERGIALWHAKRLVREFIPTDRSSVVSQAQAAGRTT